MNNKINALDVLSFFVAIVISLCGNITGGALLANVLYELRFVGMIDESKRCCFRNASGNKYCCR